MPQPGVLGPGLRIESRIGVCQPGRVGSQRDGVGEIADLQAVIADGNPPNAIVVDHAEGLAHVYPK